MLISVSFIIVLGTWEIFLFMFFSLCSNGGMILRGNFHVLHRFNGPGIMQWSVDQQRVFTFFNIFFFFLCFRLHFLSLIISTQKLQTLSEIHHNLSPTIFWKLSNNALFHFIFTILLRYFLSTYSSIIFTLHVFRDGWRDEKWRSLLMLFACWAFVDTEYKNLINSLST